MTFLFVPRTTRFGGSGSDLVGALTRGADGRIVRRSIGVEVRQPPGFIVDLPAGGFWKWLERLDLDAAVLVAPGSGDGTIDQEGRHGMRGLRVEDERPVR